MYVNPLKSARGTATRTNPTNTALIGLYNDSNTWYLGVLHASATLLQPQGCFVTPTRLGTKAQGTITPVVTGDQQPPGKIDTDDVVSFQALDYVLQDVGMQDWWVNARYPFAVLRPGWTFVLVCAASAQSMNMSFFWNWFLPDELLNNAIGDPQIDRRSRP